MGRMIEVQTRPSRRRAREVGLGNPVPARSLAGGVLRTAAIILIPVLLLAGIGIGMLYMRLSQGPMDLPSLARAIERGLTAELDGWRAKVKNAELIKTPDGLSLMLREVAVRDRFEQPVFLAPRVSVSLSTWALLQGQFVPEQITLLSPRLRLRRGQDGTLLVSVGELGAESGSGQQPTQGNIPATSPGRTAVSGSEQHFDLPDLLASAFGRNRRGGYFRSLAARDARVVLDREGLSAIEFVLGETTLEMDKSGDQPVLVAHAVLDRGRVNAELDLRVTPNRADRGFRFEAQVQGIDQQMLTSAGLNLTGASNLGMLIRASTSFAMTREGAITQGKAEIAADYWAQSSSQLAREAAAPERSGSAQLVLSFPDGLARFAVEPSTLSWGDHHLKLEGSVSADERGPWAVDLRSIEGWIQHAAFRDRSVALRAPPRLKIDSLALRGTFDGQAKTLAIETGALRASAAEADFAGLISVGGPGTSDLRINLNGVPLETVTSLWPPSLAPEARSWFVSNVRSSSPASGTVVVRLEEGGTLDTAISADFGVSDVNMSPFNGMPNVRFPAASIRLAGGTLEVRADQGTMQVPGAGEATLTGARYTAVGALTSDPRAETAVQWSSDLPSALALLALPTLSLLPEDLKTVKADGKAQADLRIVMPPPTPDWRRNVRVMGAVRITDGALSGPALPYDVTGGAINVALSEQFTDLKGSVLISGVPAQVAWQRIYTADEADQPPLRIKAVLDGTDRTQLRIGTGAIIRSGDTPVDVTVQKTSAGRLVHVDVDLTDATLALESLNWRKGPGQRAILRFDVENGSEFARRLTNLRVVGEGLAVEGWAGVNHENELVHVELPTFSIAGSRLSVKAERRSSKESRGAPPIWHAEVKGDFYNGSDFFRSLFAAPRRREANHTELGLDLSAEVDAVQGFNDSRLLDLRLQLSKRNGEVSSITATGRLDSGGDLNVRLVGRENRQLIATSTNAGNFFRLVDFYPNARSGNMRLVVDMDGSGDAQRSGTLTVRNFEVFGDPVISEVIQTSADGRPVIAQGRGGVQQRVTREVIAFELMHAPFSVGHGQFVLQDAQLRGALFGASLRGKADYRRRTLQLGGTYAPLQGLNAAFRILPGIGEILTGPRGEGIVGMTFAIQGPMDNPEVLVNPLSLAAPGIFREIFQMSPLSPEITRRGPDDGSESGRSEQPAISATPPVRRAEPPDAAIPATPEKIIGDWTSETRSAPGAIFNRD